MKLLQAKEKEFLKTLNEKAEEGKDLWVNQESSGCMETCRGRNLVHDGGTWGDEEEKWYLYFSEKGTTVHLSSKCRGLKMQ